MKSAIAHGLLMLLAVSVACTETTRAGGDDDSGTADGAGGGGSSDEGGAGGAGGAGGGAGGSNGGSGGSGGGGTTSGDTDASTGDGGSVTTADGGGGVPCGLEVCDEGACCADPFVSLCGAPIGANGCLIPSPESTSSDPRCPSVDVMGFFTIPSCCTEDGDCGIDATNFGSGCIELGMAAEMAATMGGGASFITWPSPQRCE